MKSFILRFKHSIDISPVFQDIYKNIGWGVISSIFQNILYSIFFIAVARHYNVADFSNYIIANNLYGFVLSFSALGLGQWFLREMQTSDKKIELRYTFLKLQMMIGLLFYLLNLVLTLILYDANLIFMFSIILGFNIILDNTINVFKLINIDGGVQQKTFVFLALEAILKFILALVILFYNIEMSVLMLLIVTIKLISLMVFYKHGLCCKMDLDQLIKTHIKGSEAIALVRNNYSFVIIGSLSVIFWSLGNIIVSKLLERQDVANYEIIFKVFGMAQIIPVIFSATVFPQMVRALNNGKKELELIYRKYYYFYLAYGLTAYFFTYSYSDIFIPLLFGNEYSEAPALCREMFLTMLIFPVVLLQANLLIALKKEKIDMIMNLTVLLINMIVSISGVIAFENLSVVNYSVLVSFLIFLIMQDLYLIKIKFLDAKLIAKKYGLAIVVVLGTAISSAYIDRSWFFPAFLIVTLMYFVMRFRNNSLWSMNLIGEHVRNDRA